MRPRHRWARSKSLHSPCTVSSAQGSSNVAKPVVASHRFATFGMPGSDRLWERVTQWLFVAPALIYLLLFFGYPAVANFRMSLEHYTTSSFLTGEAPFVGFENYLGIARSPLFAKTIYNTALFTIGSIAGQFGIGLALALFFHRNFPPTRPAP